MPEFAITVAARYFRRQFEKAVGKSILKVLTELITNADDSYQRLKANRGLITVEFDRRKRNFAVVDHGEGLDAKEMEDAFVPYGGESKDRSTGHRTRSLFGKGLRDVLFTQEEGVVRSIKDGKTYVCKFRWRDKAGNERPIVDVQSGPSVTPELRSAWGIPGNGTRVQFHLRAGVTLPLYATLARDLENFYMLRLISRSETRELMLRTRGSDSGWDDRLIRYEPPAASATTELGKRAWTFRFDGTRIDAQIDLQAYESEMVQGEQSHEEREGGLLVIDEDDNVLDLTLFGFDEEPAAARLFGELRLIGAGALIRSKLAGDAPEEILTETRDGFEHKHPFYKALRAEIDPWLKPFVDSERQRLGTKPSGLSDETRKRHERAFDRLNSLYRQLLGQSTGSGRGPDANPAHTDLPLEFRFPTATIRTGSHRTLQLLANSMRVPPGTAVRVSASDQTVAFPSDSMVEVPSPNGPEPTVMVPIRLEGLKSGDALVRAETDEASALVDCSVVDEEVPDLSSGIVFVPDLLELRDGERSHLVLYTDLRIVGQAGNPQLTSSNQKVAILTDQPRWEPVTKFIVKTSVAIVGRGKGEEALITARLGQAEAVAFVKVLSKRQQQDRREGGMFKGYKFAIHDRKVQAVLDTEGYVVVNLGDATNQFYFGRDPSLATRVLAERTASQTLLAELVIGECIQRAVSEAYENGKLKIRFPKDPTTDIRNYVAEQRFELGGEIHRLFAKPDLSSGN